jgi:hypothetical protein
MRWLEWIVLSAAVLGVFFASEVAFRRETRVKKT